jgi:hypothetical protein
MIIRKRRIAMAMSEVWNSVYKSDSTFFGGQPSNFALLCFNHMKTNNVRKLLELGAGHGRDTIFFVSNGIEVEALDYSVIAVGILDKISKEKRLPIKSRIFDVKANPLPFQDGYFDAVYSHMLLNMRFSLEGVYDINGRPFRKGMMPWNKRSFTLFQQIIKITAILWSWDTWLNRHGDPQPTTYQKELKNSDVKADFLCLINLFSANLSHQASYLQLLDASLLLEYHRSAMLSYLLPNAFLQLKPCLHCLH